MLKEYLPYSPLAAQSPVPPDPKGYHRLQRLNNNDQKKAIQEINKTIYQTIPKY
jgi:hypothetical protein